MKRIEASNVRFIKLGGKGKWEADCIEGSDPCIRLGFRSKQHRESLLGDWDAVWKYWSTTGGKTKGKATEFTNQVKAFYTLDEKTLWITFYKRKLYWCYASKVVTEMPDKTRVRRTLRPWSCLDANGNPLLIDNLSGAFTKVQGFRGTICSVDQETYLLKRLNGEAIQEIEDAVILLGELESVVERLIRCLGWKDFELLSDLFFTRAGWQRISSLGRTQKTIDLELLAPVTGKRALVQVKSQADLESFWKYKADFESMMQYDEMYFIVHSPTPELSEHETESPVFLITGSRLAKLVVSAGLVDWLILRAG